MTLKPFTVLSRLTIAGCAALALTACVPHLTKQQCLTINWYQMGYADGQQGRNPRNLQQDIQDCAKFKIPVNTPAYQRGWRAGVRVYCRPNNAYNMGVNGKTYNHICPSNMASRFDRAWHRGLRKYCIPATGYNLGRSGAAMPNFCAPDQVNRFRNAYTSGRRIYSAISSTQAEINAVNSQINTANQKIQDDQNDINRWQNVLTSGTAKNPISWQTRRQAYESIRQDRYDIRRQQRLIQDLESHRNFLQLQLNHERMHP